MAEVHIIGQILSGYGYPEQRLFCKWRLEHAGGWQVIEGEKEGETQTDIAEINGKSHFSHPIDVHLLTKSIQGWPSIAVQVGHYDIYGRRATYGYGAAFVPVTPGEHEIFLNTWRPKGSHIEEIVYKHIGGSFKMMNNHQNWTRKQKSVSMGTVELRLSLITRCFDRFGIQC